MFYKMYLQTFKEGKQPDYSIVADMIKLYHANGVTVLGHFVNKKRPNQTVLITVFEDEEHYNRFVTTMQLDENYNQRREYLETIREDITILDLELNKHSLLHPTQMDLSEYIRDVQNLKEVFED